MLFTFIVSVYDVCLRLAVRGWKMVVEARLIVRKSFSPLQGRLPDFLIVGVKKGGTTFLEKALCSHSMIEMSPHFSEFKKFGMRYGVNDKEVHFFNRPYTKTRNITWYKSLFNDNGKLQGEATPSYMVSDSSRRKMHEALPDAKLIILLRDPVARAYSDYNQYLHNSETPQWIGRWMRDTRTPLSFMDTIRGEYERGVSDGFLARGFYDEQIEGLFELYSPEKVLVLISEQVRRNPSEALYTTFAFLGLQNESFAFERESHVRTYKQPMTQEDAQEVYALYKSHNERLFEILGYRIPEWDYV